MNIFRHRMKLFAVSGLLLGASQLSFAACDQTLNPGANLAAAVSSAPVGSTICLNSGSYGSVNLFDITGRTGYVTVQSTTGVGASISPQTGNSRYIRFQNLTITGGLQNSCSRNIQYVGNTVTGPLTLTNSGCPDLATLFDDNKFPNINVGGGYEGRLSLIYGTGITLQNNTFGPGGASDGIFMGGNVSNVKIGPGNIFTGISQAACGSVHCDSIQGYGAGTGIVIQGNYFEKGDTFIMMPDGSSGVTVKNNVFNGNGVSYIDKIQFGSASSPVFQHNTLHNTRASFDSKTGSPATSNALVENNIMDVGSSFKTTGGSGCSGCTFRSDLFSSSANAIGTNNVIGLPTYVGGAKPTTWPGFKLTTTSLGHLAASDGTDLGATSFGSSPVPLPAPTNLVAK